MSNDDLTITSLTDLPGSETKEGQVADPEVARRLNALLGAYLNLAAAYGVPPEALKRACWRPPAAPRSCWPGSNEGGRIELAVFLYFCSSTAMWFALPDMGTGQRFTLLMSVFAMALGVRVWK